MNTLLTQPSQDLKALTTKVIRKKFVHHIFEELIAKQRFIDNGLQPDQINNT